MRPTLTPNSTAPRDQTTLSHLTSLTPKTSLEAEKDNATPNTTPMTDTTTTNTLHSCPVHAFTDPDARDPYLEALYDFGCEKLLLTDVDDSEAWSEVEGDVDSRKDIAGRGEVCAFASRRASAPHPASSPASASASPSPSQYMSTIGCAARRDAGHDASLGVGYDAGYHAGSAAGYQAGYQAGQTAGLKEGSKQGLRRTRRPGDLKRGAVQLKFCHGWVKEQNRRAGVQKQLGMQQEKQLRENNEPRREGKTGKMEKEKRIEERREVVRDDSWDEKRKQRLALALQVNRRQAEMKKLLGIKTGVCEVCGEGQGEGDGEKRPWWAGLGRAMEGHGRSMLEESRRRPGVLFGDDRENVIGCCEKLRESMGSVGGSARSAVRDRGGRRESFTLVGTAEAVAKKDSAAATVATVSSGEVGALNLPKGHFSRALERFRTVKMPALGGLGRSRGGAVAEHVDFDECEEKRLRENEAATSTQCVEVREDGDGDGYMGREAWWRWC